MHVGPEQASVGHSDHRGRARIPRRSHSCAHLLLRRRHARAARARPRPHGLQPSVAGRMARSRRGGDRAARCRRARARAPRPHARERGRRRAAVARFLGEKESHARAWSEQRDIWLVAKALGIDAAKPTLRKALARPEGLSALVVQKAFGLAMRQALSPSKLRAALALVALERAFGDNVKSGLKTEKGTALSAKAGRVLAGQLLQSPRELSTDGRLVAALERRAHRGGAPRDRRDAAGAAAPPCRRQLPHMRPPPPRPTAPQPFRKPRAPHRYNWSQRKGRSALA